MSKAECCVVRRTFCVMCCLQETLFSDWLCAIQLQVWSLAHLKHIIMLLVWFGSVWVSCCCWYFLCILGCCGWAWSFIILSFTKTKQKTTGKKQTAQSIELRWTFNISYQAFRVLCLNASKSRCGLMHLMFVCQHMIDAVKFNGTIKCHCKHQWSKSHFNRQKKEEKWNSANIRLWTNKNHLTQILLILIVPIQKPIPKIYFVSKMYDFTFSRTRYKCMLLESKHTFISPLHTICFSFSAYLVQFVGNFF